MLTCVDVKLLIFDSVLLGLYSSANILQIDVLQAVFLLFLPCF